MSRQNVELVQRAFEAYVRGGVEAMLPFFDSKVVVYAQLGLAQAGTYQGRESAARYTRAWEDAWEQMEYAPQEWLEDDGAIVVVVRYRGLGKESGVPVDDRFAWRYEFKGDKIAGWGIYASKEDALEAVHLRE